MRTALGGRVYFSATDASRHPRNAVVRKFHAGTLSLSLREAARWIRGKFSLRATSAPFTPSGLVRADDSAVRLKVSDSCPRSVPVDRLLRHKLVSHVTRASLEVTKAMNRFRTCSHARMDLDLRGKSACQVQRDLRKQLVADLVEGSDEAAFVCRQLGLDATPRCDQLELMVASMPGSATLQAHGPPAGSGLNIPLWRELHATHCNNRCTRANVSTDCYFHVVHHYLLRGYDPELMPGRTWDEFRTNAEPYINA